MLVPLEGRKKLAHTFLGVFMLVALGVGTCATTGALWRRYRGPNDTSLVPVQRIARVSAAAPDQKEKTITFFLANRGRKAVTLRQVSTSCSCVSTHEHAGAAIPPGITYPLSFNVQIPEYGISSTRIKVFYDQTTDPIELLVEASGRRSLPILKDIRNGSPTFFALRSVAEESVVAIVTREAIGSRPWLSDLTCDLETVKTLPAGITAKPVTAGGYVEREYSYRVTWRELPTSSDFVGLLRASTTSAGEPPLEVGRVSGSLGTERLISPTVIQLDPERGGEETILFEPDSGNWDLAPGTALPAWLSVTWAVVGGDRRLLVKSPSSPLNGRDRFVLPLTSSTGMKAELIIVLRHPTKSD